MATVLAIVCVVVGLIYCIGAYRYVKWMRRIDFLGYESKMRDPQRFGSPLIADVTIDLLSIVWPVAWIVQARRTPGRQ
jgi:hypothetical protein